MTTTSGLSWGIKRSFVNYVSGLDDGEFVGTSGATIDDEHVAYFPQVATSDFDARTVTGSIAFEGSVSISGHFGMMSLMLVAPRIELNGDVAELTIADPDRNPSSGARVALVTLALPTAVEDGGTLTWRDAVSTLTAEGSGAFNQQYLPGEVMDPVTFSWN